MNDNIVALINKSVENTLLKMSNDHSISNLKKKHSVKVHYVPLRYRIFGGILQSMNIQFGNFIEELMSLLISNDGRYEILNDYSGKKSNYFELSKSVESMIDEYITNCQLGDEGYCIENFPKLRKSIIEDSSSEFNRFRHDIDLLFKDKFTGVIYYLEIKYNDDHDTGKFVDINRKIIKTYGYLVRELEINNDESLVPILFFFNNKKMKGNPYLPEEYNIRCGSRFFKEFLDIEYSEISNYMETLSESQEVVKMFSDLYVKIMSK